MSRDHRKLRVFISADDLVVDVYRASASFPPDERYALQTQMRRAAVSVATNVVEGCARRTTREYVQFLSVATGSAAEVQYLLDVSQRLGMLNREESSHLGTRYTELVKGLKKLVASLEYQP